MKTPRKQLKKNKKKRMSGEQRRSQIVMVAASLFSKNGFRGTTTREIAQKAGISEAVIFKHFRRKRELYKAIIDARCSDESGQSRLMSALKGKEGLALFKTLAVCLMNENIEDPSFLRLLTYSALERHKLSDIFIRSKGLELIHFIEGRIRELSAKGAIRKVDPEAAARAFMGMVLHYCLSQGVYGLGKYYKKPNSYVAGVFVDIFFNGIKRR